MAPRKKKDPGSAMVPADLETTLAPQRDEAERSLQVIQKLDLTTQARRDSAGNVLAEIRSKIAELEKQRKDLTAPINEAKKRVDALFNVPKEYWQACNVALSERLLAAETEAEAAQMKALAAVAEAGGQVETATLMVAHDTPRTPEGLQARTSWSFEIEDESKVPDDYWIIDESYIAKRIRAGEREIPGVRIFEAKAYTKGRS
jgi:hypothetical protein